MKRKILAPGGSEKAIVAAAEAGAYGVYFGIGDFNARKGAGNLSFSKAASVFDYLRRKGLRIHITLNVIFFENELKELYRQLLYLSYLKPDRIIIQDMAVLQIARKHFPGLKFSASTQMNINNREAFLYAKELGFNPIVIAREFMGGQIRSLSKDFPDDVEIFVHGAMCYSYSGICYMSYNIGGRSGNRGECAQPCRLEYRTDKSCGTLLSMKDLNLYPVIDTFPEVSIFKVEGRLKSPDYVYSVTDVYANMRKHYRLDLVFHREYSDGHITHRGNRESVMFTHSDSRGVFLGKAKKKGEFYEVKLKFAFALGDGVYSPEEDKGAVVKSMYDTRDRFIKKASRGDTVRMKLPFSKNVIKLLLSSSHEVSWNTDINFRPAAFIDVPLDLTFERDGVMCEGEGIFFFVDCDIQRAEKRPLDENVIRKAFEKTGDSVYRIIPGKIRLTSDSMFVPISVLNDLRKEIVNKISEHMECIYFKKKESRKNPLKSAVLNSFSQFTALRSSGCDFNIFYVPAEEIENYFPEVIPALPPVMNDSRTDYTGILSMLYDLGYRKVLAADMGGIYLAEKNGFSVHLDNTLNVSNPLSAEFWAEHKCECVCVSYEVPDPETVSAISGIMTEVLVFGRRLSMVSASCIRFNSGECKSKRRCRDWFEVHGKRDSFAIRCHGCNNYFYEHEVYDNISEKINADYARYDFRGFRELPSGFLK
ncbi:MAG: U32 family peptidase [Candidatus Muiribacteriaceae bacterium]